MLSQLISSGCTQEPENLIWEKQTLPSCHYSSEPLEGCSHAKSLLEHEETVPWVRPPDGLWVSSTGQYIVSISLMSTHEMLDKAPIPQSSPCYSRNVPDESPSQCPCNTLCNGQFKCQHDLGSPRTRVLMRIRARWPVDFSAGNCLHYF